MRIPISDLRDGDVALALDHAPSLFDLDSDDWRFQGRVTGEVTFHLTREEVLAHGRICAHATGQCNRCLDPVPVDIDVAFKCIFLPAEQEPIDDVALEHVPENLPDIAYYREETIEPLGDLRDTLLLALPNLPHCPQCEPKRGTPVHIEGWPTEQPDNEPEWKRRLRGLSPG